MSEVKLPANVAVIGGGRMGSGIAHAFLTHGCRVSVVETNEAAANAAADRVKKAVHASAERGRLEGTPQEALERLATTTELADIAQADLIIEAIVEDMEVKSALIRDVELHARPDAYIASNTSSLSLTRLAGLLKDPSRLIGLHFFNPVPASKLVEIVLAEQTDAELAQRALEWVKALGKTPITVKDSPGFATSRLGLAIAIEAMRMVEEGVASAEDIDTGMVLGYKFPIGPLALTDLVGLDVRLGIATALEQELGERFAPPQILRDLVAAGHLGRKTGRGFYCYNDKE